MVSYYILCIFTTVFVLIQCQEFHHEENVDHHKYTDVVKCEKSEIISNHKAASLRPRERHVVLKPKPGFEFTPRTVSVKRCNGQCPGQLSPMATAQVPKTFTVHLHPKGDAYSLKCVSVQVQEHMACRCMCIKSEKDCNALQVWDKANCDCRCKDRESSKYECETNKSMVWQDTDCTCKCPGNFMACAYGMKWSLETCECVRN